MVFLVSPTSGSATTLRPFGLADVRISGGFWGARQTLNREVTLPTAMRRLDEAGNFDNLRLATGKAQGTYRGRPFADTDIYKTLEGVAWERAREPSERLASWQDETTAVLAETQAADGYLNSYFQFVGGGRDRFTDLGFGHELYGAGHLIQVAVAARRATGEDGLLRVARRFTDLLVETFGPDGQPGVPGHPEIEMALVELYRLTRHRPYLDLARYFVDARGRGLLGPGQYGPAYYQDRVPVREADGIEGHAVRATYLAAGVTDLFIETGERALLDAMLRQWNDMTSAKTYLTGGIGSRWNTEAFGHPYELPPDRAYCETCAAIGSIMWSWRMLLATGEARFAEAIERALYNAFAAGTSLDGTRFFYVNPLQLRGGTPADHERHPAHGRQPWYRTACCPPNVIRMLSSLHHYLVTSDETGLQLHQYAAGTVDAELVSLRVDTDYPWSGRVEIAVLATPEGPWTLSLRVPAWCGRVEVAVNGSRPGDEPRPGEYVRLRRPWRAGDQVVLDMAMPPRVTVPDRRIDAVRGCVAIERGPLVYCLEQADQPDKASVDNVLVEPDPGGLRAVDRPDLLGGVVAIEAPGRLDRSEPTEGLPYADWIPNSAAASTAARPAEPSPVRLTAIPYYAWANRDAGPMRVWIPTG
ncbi:MAG: glycoside hydrolase family 127 protein [Streptosporangiales bacterium]|nr:glycoside hydrolase family 127 protein [Streptosporangiales bacterium]